MELLLFVLVLVSFCGAQTWTPPAFCHGKPCPEYSVVETNTEKDYELRSYVATDWITTKMAGTTIIDFTAARTRLSNVGGYSDSWPSLATVKNGSEYWLSWFVAPGSNVIISNPLVIKESRPKADVYVRTINAIPGIKEGKEKAEKFCEDLTYSNCNSYSAAGYDTFWSTTHHNEIWINKI
ncbi:heme-binding protein soul2 [Sebastes umbrosus]|uniref:heme-binding protein soul2 n=1 Tax=Sebastes umbrosus TaxID=72105 RepID=UPI0018A041C9|nr:heme-binding protein soul2 [Sebastes umbrosus]